MFYSFTVNVPANTDEADAVTSQLRLAKGVIEYAEVQFPIGTRCLVHVQLSRGGHPIYPVNADSWIQSDGYVVPIKDPIDLTAEPFELVFKGWSEANTYSYDIDVRVSLVRYDELEKMSPVSSALTKFLKLVGVR